MSIKRIIPRLDIKGPNLVKGIHLEGLRVLGKPSDFAEYYYNSGADELILMDVVASLYGRNNLSEIISQTSKEVFIPITVGGGLRTISDIQEVLRAGADKVAINTAAINRPTLIKEAAEKFGSSTILIAIEVIKSESGHYYCFTDNGREDSGVELLSWIDKVQSLGAGEIMLTSVDKEGTGNGFDLELLDLVEKKITLPFMVHGGLGEKKHVHNIFTGYEVDAVVASSIFHYEYLIQNSNDVSNHSGEGNFDYISSGRTVKNIQPINVYSLKKYLYEKNIDIRN